MSRYSLSMKLNMEWTFRVCADGEDKNRCPAISSEDTMSISTLAIAMDWMRGIGVPLEGV